MATRKRVLVGALIVGAWIAFFPQVLQSTNQETNSIPTIGDNHNSLGQRGVVTRSLSGMPLSFTENRGQFDGRVKFRA